MTDRWQDQIAGARMQVDQKFADRVASSRFTNQEWGLIMTAVEFDIESPGDVREATLVARTEKIPDILPELENLPQGMGMGQPSDSGASAGGLFDGLREALGFGGSDSDGVDQEQLAAATELVDAYAVELQQHLEEQGRWESLCERAASEKRV